jgi:Methyltransferase domain
MLGALSLRLKSCISALNCQLLVNRYVLLERMPKNAVCAEIGILECDYSESIVRGTGPAQLHLIDINPQWTKVARKRFKSEIAANPVCVHERDSVAVISSMPDRYFDWVYIDGDHTHAGAKRDLDAILPKVKEGGLIALNDHAFLECPIFEVRCNGSRS